MTQFCMASRSTRRSAAPARAPQSKMAASASSSPTSASEAVEAARKRKQRELVKRSYYQKLVLYHPRPPSLSWEFRVLIPRCSVCCRKC